MLPFATQAISKVAPALATGAAQALGSFEIKRIFGDGSTQRVLALRGERPSALRGGFMIPQNKIDQ